MTVRPTKIPGIPKPPASAGPELRRYLESLSEAIEIRLGRKGDPRDRAVTLRELIESGLARELRATPFDPNNLSAGNLGFVSDDVVDVTSTPPQPTGFAAAGAYSVINLTWDFPLYTGPNHSHTEIYSYPSDNLASAIAQGVIGVITGRAYVDPVGSNITRYYWIRHVNEHGTFGPWNSGSGTVATTAPDVTHLLGVLSSSITSSELASSLSTPIGQIPGMQVSLNGNSNLISGLTGNVNTLTQNQANFATTAQLGGYVTTTTLTSNYYTLNQVDQAITAEINNFNSSTLSANYTNTADLQSLYYTKTNADGAISGAITNYNTNTIGANYTTTADLESSYYTKTDADNAFASTSDILNAEVDNPDGSTNQVSLAQAATVQASTNGDLKGQYTVKIDTNGAVAGFGLASTSTAAGNITSEFIVNADRFAIMRGGSDTTAAVVPFAVVPASTVDGVAIPAGVYMDTAFIRNAAITAAQIGSVNADKISAGTINAGRIGTNSIDASKLNIDGSSITSTVVNGVPTLQLGSVNVNQLTGNSISANIMSGTTVYANRLTGDVNKLLPFRSTTAVSFKGNNASGGGTVQIIAVQLPATTHLTVGHKPFGSITGWYDSTANKTYSFKLYMQLGSGTYQLVGETRFKANTNLYAQFAVSGSLATATTSTVNMKLEVTRTGSSGIYDSDTSATIDRVHEVSGFILGAR